VLHRDRHLAMRFLCLPKTVRISNVRLNIVYLILMSFTWVVVILKFVHQKEYSHQRNGIVTASVWPTGYTNVTTLQSHYQASRDHAYCKNNYRYEYNSEHKYNVTGCADPTWAPHYIQESDSSVVFPTHIREERQNSTTENFTTSTDILGIAWEYSFQDEANPGQQGFQYKSSHDITTFLIGNNGDEKRIAAGEQISLTMSKLFEMAGFSNLDSVSPNARLIGASSTYAAPIHRLAGIQLDLHAQCQPQYSVWNFISLWSRVKSPMDCRFHVRKSARNWVYVRNQKHRDEEGKSFTMVYHGVRVTFSQLHVEEIAPSKIIESVADAFVLLSIPVMLMDFVMVYFLGALSSIYRMATDERFSIQKEVGSMVVRLIAMSAIFVDLQDDSGLISKERCQERLTVLFSHVRDLSPVEVESMADYCYTSVVTNTMHETQGLGHALTKIIQGVHRGKDSYKSEISKGIDNATFSAACGSMEKIGFRELIALFDWERRGSCLERFFMPNDLHAALASHRKNVEQKRMTGGSTATVESGSCQTVTSEEHRLTLEERKEEVLKRVHNADQKICSLEKIQTEIHDKCEVHSRVLHTLQHEFHEKMKKVEGKLDPETSTEGTGPSKEASRQHRSTTQDVLAMIRVVEACNAECSMLQKSIESIANTLANMGMRLQSVEEGMGFETGSHCTMSAIRESTASLEPILKPEATSLEPILTPKATDATILGSATSTLRANAKVAAITPKVLADKVENLCFRLSLLEEAALAKIGDLEASCFVEPNDGDVPPPQQQSSPEKERESGVCLHTAGRWRQC